MKRYRLGYLLFVLFSIGLLYESGTGFFLGLVCVECLFPVILFCMLRREARQISLTWEIKPSGVAGQAIALELPMRSGRCLAAGSILLDVQVENRLLCETEQKHIVIPMRQGKEIFREELIPESCGSHILHCENIRLQDMFGLFRRDLSCLPDLAVSVYPETVPMELLPQTGTAERQVDGQTAQSKKGNDRTEIYDLREYTAGDDIRSIHWKLSSKIGKQIVREAGSSTQMQTLVLLDAGLCEHVVPVRHCVLCTGFSVAFGLSDALIRQGFAHALGMHLQDDLELMSVREENSCLQALEQGLASPLPKECGHGLLLYLMQKREYSFTRLFYITTAAELPLTELRSVEGAEVIVLHVEDRSGKLRYDRQESMEVISIPAAEPIETAIKLMI